ncbi:MAG: type I restriction endonuclease [Planctomycetota bacterium]
MPASYKESHFEAAIEDHLLQHGGYVKGDPRHFDAERALDPTILLAFIRETQSEPWAALAKLKGSHEAAASLVLDELGKAMDSRGALDVLRYGFKCYGKKFVVAHFKPTSGLNPELQKLYDANVLTVTRQVHYSVKDPDKSIDLLLSLNGLPIATAELKNPMTGQNVNHARHQYAHDRDPRETIFTFKRGALVHFAVDPDWVFMTTKLAGKSTYFLPFNLGSGPNGTGAGNPERQGKHRTWYLWEQVWQRDSLMDIVGRFLHLEIKEKRVAGKRIVKETMIFPRYHQLDAVRQLEHDARLNGPGQNYLIQHSAGSGKSNSIGWLAHRLAFLHDDRDKKIFDSVVVITDRVILDQQLQDTIYQFEHKRGVVQKIDENTAQLAEALRGGTPIIITTLQKFPYVTDQIRKQAEEEAKSKGLPVPADDAATLPGGKFAVIIDEAHSSQSGETAAEMKAVLASDEIKTAAKRQAELEELEDYQEVILREMKKRPKQPNISFFAFTATPKHKTLEVFGTRLDADPNTKPVAFHLYSMRQAIEEGFILDVLKHYTTYKTYFGLIKQAEEDPKVEKRNAAKALARFMNLHPVNVESKVEVIVEHFRSHTRHKIGGKAKAMVVTGGRQDAVRYKQAFDKYISEKGYDDVDTLVAFSGTVIDDLVNGKTYTEGSLNKGIAGREIPRRFDTDEYQILIAADKFQTGFDQPLLHTMYVDKRLAGIQAVQTLSRLNRTHSGKDSTFVLDFHNDREEILKAFQDYYEVTNVGDEADPSRMYALQADFFSSGVFDEEGVEDFCRVFFAPRKRQTPTDHAKMNATLDAAVDRFKALRDELKPSLTEDEWRAAKEEAQEKFRGTLQAFRGLYSFLSQVIPYEDSELEKLYAFARFLLKKLPRPDAGPAYQFDDDVALKFYRLQKIADGAIALQTGVGGELKGPADVGTGRAKDEEVELSRLIDLLNDRFGTEFKPADQLFLDSVREDALASEELREAANANTIENFKYVFSKALEGLFIDRMEQNEDIFNRFMSDAPFQELVEETLRRQVYEQARTSEPAENQTESES